MTVLTYNKLKLNEWNREFDWKMPKLEDVICYLACLIT